MASGSAPGINISQILAAYSVDVKDKDVVLQALEAVYSYNLVPIDATRLLSQGAQQMREKAGQIMRSSHFHRGIRNKQLLPILIELTANHCENTHSDYSNLTRLLKATVKGDFNLSAAKMAMTRLREDLYSFAAQSLDSNIIEVVTLKTIVKHGRHHYEVRLTQRPAFDLLEMPPRHKGTSYPPVLCSAIQLDGQRGLSVLLSHSSLAIPEESIKPDQGAAEKIRSPRTSILWAMLGLSEPDPVANPSDLTVKIYSRRDMPSLFASEIAVPSVDNEDNFCLLPSPDEAEFFRWSTAFHIKRILPMRDVLQQLQFDPAPPTLLSQLGRRVTRVWIVRQGNPSCTVKATKLNGEAGKRMLGTTLKQSTALCSSNGPLDLTWTEGFLDRILKDKPPPWVLELTLPPCCSEADYLNAARIISGRPSVTANERRLIEAIGNNHGAVIISESPDDLFPIDRFVNCLRQVPWPRRLILLSIRDPESVNNLVLRDKLRENVKTLVELRKGLPKGVLDFVLREREIRHPCFILDDDTVLRENTRFNVAGIFFDIVNLIQGSTSRLTQLAEPTLSS